MAQSCKTKSPNTLEHGAKLDKLLHKRERRTVQNSGNKVALTTAALDLRANVGSSAIDLDLRLEVIGAYSMRRRNRPDQLLPSTSAQESD